MATCIIWAALVGARGGQRREVSLPTILTVYVQFKCINNNYNIKYNGNSNYFDKLKTQFSCSEFFVSAHKHFCQYYRGADKSLARPGRKQASVSVRMAWISFSTLPCRKKNLMTARVSMLKSCVSLTCFRACFLPDRAKDYQHPGYLQFWYVLSQRLNPPTVFPW